MVYDCYQRLKGELQKLTWPYTPILLNVDNNSVSGLTSSEETSLEEDMEVAVPSDSVEEPVMGDDEDEDDHQVAGNDFSDKLPPPGKVWKGGTPLMYGIGAIHVLDKCPQGHVARFRYQTLYRRMTPRSLGRSGGRKETTTKIDQCYYGMKKLCTNLWRADSCTGVGAPPKITRRRWKRSAKR